MWADLLPIDRSYFPHLRQEGVKTVLDLRYDPTCEGITELLKALHRTLEQTLQSDYQWCFSFVGSPVNEQNLSVLTFFDQHQFEVAFRATETRKLEFDAPACFTEISFICSVDLLSTFLKNPHLNFGWDFQLGGWLVKKEDASATLTAAKFNNGFQCPSAIVKLGFCSSDDWDCLQFFSADSRVLKVMSEKLNTPSQS